MFLRKTAQFPDISTVAPSTDFFKISVFLKHMHQEFMYHRNFGWKLKSNLLPLLVQCASENEVAVPTSKVRFSVGVEDETPVINLLVYMTISYFADRDLHLILCSLYWCPIPCCCRRRRVFCVA